jgi:branched-chain amino acid aminotransferase
MVMIITNSGIVAESEFQPEEFNSDHAVYEVIRVIDGVALFLEDHFNRLQKSIEMQGLSFSMEFPYFKHQISVLIRLNQIQNGNIKSVFSGVEMEKQWAFTFISASYPGEVDYLNGVSTDLFFAKRENPNAKVIQSSIREKADRIIDEQKLYEVLLVNSDGQITEGSRSNVFFVKDDVFFTAPSSDVLVGITRQKVLGCLNDLGFHLVEEAVKASEIDQYDGVFLTGTSPKVLSVRSIGNRIFPAQLSVVKKLMESYDERITQYILLARTFY